MTESSASWVSVFGDTSAFTSLRPMTCSPSHGSSIDFRDSVSFLLTIQATGLLTLALTGLTPVEYTGLYWTYDHDPLYRFQQWQANLRVLEVAEIKTVPYLPLSHPFVEHLIGTVRRELSSAKTKSANSHTGSRLEA